VTAPDFRARRRPRAPGTWLLLCAALLAPLAAFALPDDRDQPIYIQSDRAERDERTGTTLYTGDVEIDQGSLHISADRVTIQDADAQVSEIHATGAPAKMRQKTSPEREPVYARAKTIQYDVATEVLTLIDGASVTQEGTTVTGDRIVYFVREQRVKASGGAASGRERVKVVIPPRRAAEPAVAPEAAPTAGQAPADAAAEPAEAPADAPT